MDASLLPLNPPPPPLLAPFFHSHALHYHARRYHGLAECNVCMREYRGPFYTCSQCDYDCCLVCAEKISSGMEGDDPRAHAAPYTPAPVLAKVRPFLPDARRDLLRMLDEESGVLRATASALTALMRIQDRVAHYLILRAVKGHNTRFTR